LFEVEQALQKQQKTSTMQVITASSSVGSRALTASTVAQADVAQLMTKLSQFSDDTASAEELYAQCLFSTYVAPAV